MHQMPLPIQLEPIPTILGCPIVDRFWHHNLHVWVEVVGGRYAGKEFVYLAHLAQPLSRVQHYLGSTKNLERRYREHQRKYPIFRFTDLFFTDDRLIPDRAVRELLLPLRGRTFRRYHTLHAALRCYLKHDAEHYRFQIMRAIKQHTTNGILMAANRRGIPWHLARVFQADRKFEQALKRQKLSFRFICPACQGVDAPF